MTRNYKFINKQAKRHVILAYQAERISLYIR